MEDHQPQLPGFTLVSPGKRREPCQRKDESWQAYAHRYNTWWYLTHRESTPEEKEAHSRMWADFREHIMRSTEVHCYQMVEAKKRKPAPSWAVFFWFGGDHPMEIRAGLCQYVNQTSLDYLISKGVLDPNQKARSRRGKNRVSFGRCFQ